MSGDDRDRRHRLGIGLAALTLLLWLAGLAAGSEGWSLQQLLQTWRGPDGALIIGEIRAPRTLGAWLTGALLGPFVGVLRATRNRPVAARSSDRPGGALPRPVRSE